MEKERTDDMEKFECDDCGCYFWVEDRSDFTCPNCVDKAIDKFKNIISEDIFNAVENIDYVWNWLSKTNVIVFEVNKTGDSTSVKSFIKKEVKYENI